MLISDLLYLGTAGVLEVQGVPSPTHSHLKQMALTGLGYLNEPLLSVDVA